MVVNMSWYLDCPINNWLLVGGQIAGRQVNELHRASGDSIRAWLLGGY